MTNEKEQTFEEKLTTLESIVTQLEKGEIPLEQAIEVFQKGVTLSKDLQKSLQTAEQSLTKIVQDDGQIQDFQSEDK
ncbi:exodeoxyribonuclease VII small subunit [Weissella kandleri]|uniref:exodeoxyribonuclease VII small subunit n=1 Tax=Weissella kandleri TaxID=1616 RepID=UPI00387E25E6